MHLRLKQVETKNRQMRTNGVNILGAVHLIIKSFMGHSKGGNPRHKTLPKKRSKQKFQQRKCFHGQ